VDRPRDPRRLAPSLALLAALTACRDPATPGTSADDTSTTADPSTGSSPTTGVTESIDESSSTASTSDTGEPLPPHEPADLFGSIDPFLGTGGIGFRAASVYPGPALPFGMIHPGPDTRLEFGAIPPLHCSGYYYTDTHIEGFSLTRMNGTGVPDYGTMALMPVDGMSDARRSEDGYMTAFGHAEEAAEPGYYRVRLDSGIDVEITATRRAAIFRFTFDDGLDPVILLDADHVIGDGECDSSEVAVDPEAGSISARMHNLGDLSHRFGGFDVFAHARFDTEPAEVGVWDDAGLRPGELTATGVDTGAWFRFAEGTKAITLRVGMSFVDANGAVGNLEAEIPDFDFDAVRAAATSAWQAALAGVSIYDVDEHDAIMLGTAWYRALLMPTLVSDVDGRAMGADDVVYTSDRERYSDFSLWDTYRTTHPWFLLLEREENADFAHSLVTMAEEGGAVPRWALAKSDARSMIGSPGEIVLVESALKGVPFEDEAAAYALARVSAFGPPPGLVGGRSAIEPYLAYGYVPSDENNGSVSHTQEYAIADAALARWAEHLGYDDDAALLGERGSAWAQVYDERVGFFRPRLASGEWDELPDPTAHDGPYVEGTAWQYLWLVPHDPDGLAELLGGPEAARERLLEYFELSDAEADGFGPRLYHWQGNQPDIHAPWLFAMWGDPAAATVWIDWVVRRFYDVGPNGMPGNDDAGTMSTWLLFAASGLYPMPGTDLYMIAAPRQRLMELARPSGTLRISAEPDPRTHPVPLAVRLDGVLVEGPTLTHAELEGEHELAFEMGQ
jgi:predicted alpha-1,2-mannosidase